MIYKFVFINRMLRLLFIYQINSFLKCIDNIEESIKEKTKIIKDLTSLTKKDSEQLYNLRQMLDNILERCGF